MTYAVIDRVAIAVQQELSAGAWSQEFVPRRVEDNTIELEDLDTLHVDVMPGEVTIEEASEEASQVDVEVQIAVRKRFGLDDQVESTGEVDQADIDALRRLTYEIASHFMHQRELTFLTAWCTAAKFNPHSSPAMLREQRQFTAIIRLTCRVYD